MSTLQANSTFLPVLDDLLSPDFRTVSLPGQTPQTPAETPVSATGGKSITFVESHTGQLTSKASNYAGVKESSGGDPSSSSPHKKDIMTTSIMTTSIMSSSSSSQGQMNGGNVKKLTAGGQGHHSRRHSHQSAALAIQQWWKVRRMRRYSTGDAVGGQDLRAERAKHSIRHSRTEEHVRFLETEVHRLKSALATERKLRSLQVEAIRSLWSQVQKVTSASPAQGQGQQDVMSQSMPNGLPFGGGRNVGGGCMSMSVHGTLDNQSQSQSDLTCSCSKEIQDLKESFSSELFEMRKMIDQLKVDGSNNGEDSKAKKRPLTLNLSGNGSGGRPGSATKDESHELENVAEGKKEIAGYANQMASSIIEDAKEQED